MATLVAVVSAASCSHLAPYVQGPLPRPPTGDPRVSIDLPPALDGGASATARDPGDPVFLQGTLVAWSALSEPGPGFQMQVATESGPLTVRVVTFEAVSWSLSPGTPVRVGFLAGPDGIVLRLEDARGLLFFLAQGAPSLDPTPMDPPVQVRPRSSQVWVEVREDEALCHIVTSHRSGEAILPDGRLLVLTPGVAQEVPDAPLPFRLVITMNRRDLENSCGDAPVSRFGWWWMRLPAPFRSPPQRTIPAATGRPGPSTRPPDRE